MLFLLERDFEVSLLTLLGPKRFAIGQYVFSFDACLFIPASNLTSCFLLFFQEYVFNTEVHSQAHSTDFLFILISFFFFFFQGTSTPHFRTHYQDKLLLNCYLESFFPHANFDILLHVLYFIYFFATNPQRPMKT